MNTQIKPIPLNATSFDVAVLHQALRTLGLQVSAKEAAAHTAGADTVKKVRKLQAQLKVPVDASTLVDARTAVAMRETLRARGQVDSEKSFTVSGTVRLANGEPLKKQLVVAFDLDLRAVAIYRTMRQVREFEKNSGFEVLGTAISDNRGAYEITFYDWQYRNAERKKADVVVYAIERTEIIGRSRIVNSDDYSDKGRVTNLDVSITRKEPRTEHEILMEALNAFLKESKTSLAEIAGSSDQLIFTAGELDVNLAHLKIAANAELLSGPQARLSHELLYGIGRQNISLVWESLLKKTDDELHRALKLSAQVRIIRAFSDRDVNAFLKSLRASAGKGVLDSRKDDDPLKALLSTALPTEKQRLSYLNAINTFTGSDFRSFWSEHLAAQPEFKDNPKLISNLILTQQLFLLTGDNGKLVTELQKSEGISSQGDLFNLKTDDWARIVKKSGVPDSVPGKTLEEKQQRYVKHIEGTLNAAFPTQRIARMAEVGQLEIETARIATGVTRFLKGTANFDIARSRIQDFDKQIEAVARQDAAEVKGELKKIQRVFQVSPNPKAMNVLLSNKLLSAHEIAGIPEKSFLRSYSGPLGGEDVAFAVHQRATYVNTKSEHAAMHLQEYTTGYMPAYVLGKVEGASAMAVIENKIPNYAELFGSPDLCECEQCNSVYGAASYFVDLLRFLSRSARNDETPGRRPLRKLTQRRPDLVHLLLTCENTNTIIPYIDLANEIMEYYTSHDSLTSFEGYDTGETTAEELRANPQNFDLEAYRRLKDKKYPFTLPYHQPLDVIRIYSGHLKVSRYEALKAMNPQPDATATRAIEAESLALCQEEYQILTDENFAGVSDPTPLRDFFGYTNSFQLQGLNAVREFLKRSGVAYTDLVELVESYFINPFQGAFHFLQGVFSFATIEADEIYARLEQIESGALDPADDADIVASLNAYNASVGASVTAAEFGEWVTEHLGEFRRVITLYQPQSSCDLDTTSLKTIESVYAGSSTSGLGNATWSRFHRFIRLWRKLGWTILETDLMLAALGEANITPETITKLESVTLLKTATKLAPNQLAVFWGNIDTRGKKSLYRKLFLNKAVQQIDDAFKADAWGDYLQDETQILGDHQSAIVAAFRITEEEYSAILQVAQVIDAGVPRPLDPATDTLNIQNVSTIYRYVMLAKGLKIRALELCKLMQLFGASPFSTWDIQAEEFVTPSPADTYAFYKLAEPTRTAGFKSATLEYILQGTFPVDSNIGLVRNNVLQAARDVRSAFGAIELSHPDIPAAPLTTAALTAALSLTFQSDIVVKFMQIVEGTVLFEAMTDLNLDVTIPGELATKYSYIKGSGRLTCNGVMSDDEQTALKALANTNVNFDAAVDELYAAPEILLSENFDGVFSDLAEANLVLLDHPEQLTAATLDEKLTFVYEHFVPILKSKLRRDTIARDVAALIGLSETATALLMAGDVDSLISSLSTEGFSANYFSDATWTTSVLEKTDALIDFSWGSAAPDPVAPADNFSVRWRAYLAPPASGEYTLTVETEEADEAFNLYLDDALILSKTSADTATSWEIVTQLNAAQMHQLTLEYTEAVNQAGVRLFWKTATTAKEIIPTSAAYPATILDSFIEQVTIYHRAAKFILGFELSETELNHFINFSADFGNLDFHAINAGDWSRIYDYSTLRDAVPQALALLTDVFTLANTLSPIPIIVDLAALLHQATAWDEASLDFLVNTHFALTIDDFKNEIALKRIHDVMKIVSKSGLSAENIAIWGATETDFDALNTTAQIMKNAVKAKYEDEDWLELAGDLSDKIRENQKNALIAHLLTRPEIQRWGVTDADGLFEYFLIDVQMGACMDTSRIVQANSSVQMFVNRCLLNLESRIAGGAQLGVAPEYIDKDRWEWMKNYRVWEANRKVFLYPENWLEPEWRNDRSDFFKDLESYLVQNDISDRSVEQAFRDYLTSLNQVANLEVCGLHREDYDDAGIKDGELKYLHVVARTHNAPYKFFYRTWNEHQKWSAWEKLPVDIRCIEAGAASGVHVMPVVWKNRLFVFWPEFVEKQYVEPKTSQKVANATDGYTITTAPPEPYWEVRLGWSEYVEGKWGPKQISKEFVEHWPDVPLLEIKDLLFTVSGTQELTITLTDAVWNVLRGNFKLADIQSPVEADDSVLVKTMGTLSSVYDYQFSNRKATATLELMDDVYLREVTSHRLLPVDTFKGLDLNLDSPFFFSDRFRTYFVRPVPISITEWIKDPEVYKPHLPGLVDDSGYLIPEIPEYGPEDYIPVDILDPLINPGTATYYLDVPGETNPLLVGLGGGPGNAGIPASLPMSNMMTRGGSMDGSPISGTMARRSTAGETRTGESMAAMTSTASTAKAGYVGGAFTSSLDKAIYSGWGSTLRNDTGLEFHTFYHPFSSNYVSSLNLGGVSGLMESGTTIPSDDGALFENAYSPNFTQGFVQTPADFATGTYYKENVCFWNYGANSLYNWELFFHAPLYIATRLSKNGKFEEAMKWFHYIFDPTTDDMPGPGETEISRYWKVLPFKTTPAESLEDWFRNNLSPNPNPNNPEDAIIGEWRDNPFDPHLVASNRPLAYMKHVVVKYVENLIAWGDSLFRQDTMESVNEALQIYVIANHILGARPEFVPKRGEIKAESYDSLSAKWDDFSNALVELENIFPYSSGITTGDSSSGSNLLGVGSAFYFCIPTNDKLLGLWDTVADRLFKIRHCQNLQGIERKLALFAPPIDPAALIQAASQGLSLGSILAALSSPPPIYRFSFLSQKANEFCREVTSLGNALLGALEKKDAEELGRLRASHETQILELMTAIKQRNILDAKARKEGLEKSRETASFRFQHYLDLLGNSSPAVPQPPTISVTLTATTQLPADTPIAPVATDVDQSLVASEESGVKLISREQAELDKSNLSTVFQTVASGMEGLAGTMNFIPNFSANLEPFGCGATISFGGSNIAGGLSGLAKIPQIAGNILNHESILAGKMATYIRREQDWTLQANLAAKEIIQLDKQITSADIQIQVAEKELAHHQQQIENSKQVELFLKDKFTNQELYQWMKEQLFAVYKQSYNLAYDMAKKAEKAYQYEMGTELASFIQYGYWDNSTQGLVAGEKLQLALRQLEKSYLEENRRELELSKSVSLALLNPLALIELRETGKCYVSLPEEIFDFDFAGHFFRRIKAVTLSIPCVAGPYTAVNCSLRLLGNHIRVNTSLNGEGNYEHEHDEGFWVDDTRFRSNNVPVTSIAASTGQNDSGMFEFNFRDERYLPFEGAGAISDWQIELSTEKEFRQFDYATISDVILHLKYTARENGGLFKDGAIDYLKRFITNPDELAQEPLVRGFSMKHEFSTEWHRFLHPAAVDADQILSFTIGKQQFPFFAQDRNIVVTKLELLARCAQEGDYRMVLSLTNLEGETDESTEFALTDSEAYGGMKKATLGVSDASLSLDEMDVTQPMSIKLRSSTVTGFKSLTTDPDEVADLFLVVHCKFEALVNP